MKFAGFELMLMKYTLGFVFIGVIGIFLAKIVVLMKLFAIAKVAALKAWFLKDFIDALIPW